ncbi:MAG: VWA domain-containing protein [Tannerella sp.]|jgi:hypothetical protein|nr:VWA domain-containing protein [Tannerella sp.]
MKQFLFTGYLCMSILLCGCKQVKAENPEPEQAETAYNAETVKGKAKIQVAILLDTSSSMDGLIEQAKSRLWNIVNTLTTLKLQGKEPVLEIALYEYGNNNIHNDEYIRQVLPLSTDLDLISQKLFALTTLGGDEYCGAVINKATQQLEWGKNDNDIRLIYIAGNEPFTQGRTHYIEAINNALAKNIFINTIHCGDAEEGIDGKWRDGAVKGKGKYFNINHNERVRYISTPYDDRISGCNARLNATYIGYGELGEYSKQNQRAQDVNARSISAANETERIVSKSKSVYKNSSWDLVDLAKEDAKAVEKIADKDLPDELQGKSKDELKVLLAQKEAERKTIQEEIETLAKQRQAYIDEETKKQGDGGDDLGKAITQSVLDVALAKGYTAE